MSSVITQSEMESRLWGAADELRAKMPESQYASVMFPLMFWKFLSDTWDHNHEVFLTENTGIEWLTAEEAHEVEYRDYQTFEIPMIERGKVGELRASWGAVLTTITQPGLGARVRASLQAIETANPDKFSGLFGSLEWTRTGDDGLDGPVLVRVMQAMDRVPKMFAENVSYDVLGGAYEYLLKRFSDGSGTRAGQFFTPREVVELIVRLLDPHDFDSVYDPACGSGGMLIAAANLLKSHDGRPYTLRLSGQESVSSTAGVARMNLFIHNLTSAVIRVGDTLHAPEFKKADGSVEQFDVVLANPPYSLKWDPWINDARAIGGIAPRSSADWAFVQHMIASMKSKTGRAGVVLPHGVLFRSGQEAAIRRKVVEEDLLEAVIGLPPNLFYSTTIPTCILIFRARGTKAEERRSGVLFIDASQRFAKAKLRNVLRREDIADTVTAYHSAFDADGQPVDPDGEGGIQARFVPLDEIKTNAFDLNIGRYLKAAAAEQADLGTLIEAYNLARAERQRAEERMLAVLAQAGIEGFDE